MEGAAAAGGVGSSEGPTTESEWSALSGTSETVAILRGLLPAFFLELVAISHL